MSNFARAVKALNDVDEAIDHLADNEAYVTALESAGLLAPDTPELAQALAEETWEYQVQTRTPRMPTWSAITDDTLQKWYPEDKYKNLIRSKQGSGWVEVRVLRRRVSPVEIVND